MTRNGRRPKIVVIGGGTGLPVILKSLRDKNADITAIVTVADDGGSSGIIRDYVNVVPPGDIRNVIAALSELPELYLDIFQYRFDTSDRFFAGHAIGNLIIAALAEMKKGVFASVQELSEMMRVDGHVYPVADEPLVLNAEFSDGTFLSGEAEITAARKSIKRVWVTSSETSEDGVPAAVPEVVKAILEADQIVLGPGSLFTSILPNLVIGNVGKALSETKAEVVYICNIMTQKGETERFTDADHVRILNNHLGNCFVNTVLVNTAPVPSDYMDKEKYDENLIQVEHDFNGLRGQHCRVISSNFLKLKDKGVFHDGDKVVEELMRLVGRPNHELRHRNNS
ncbi:gluconeogenesis factor YvcK family protein [Dellaglioa sp. BT-FLS60]